MKALVETLKNLVAANDEVNVSFWFFDGSGGGGGPATGLISLVGITTISQLRAGVVSAVLSEAGTRGFSLTEADILWGNILSREFSNPSRTLNSAFQISTSRDAQVSYSVDIVAALTLSGGQVGTVFVEYADDSGFTTNVVEIGRSVNGNTGTLALGLAITQTSTATVAGVVPAGKFVRLRTANTTGSPTFTFRSSQEVLI